LHGSKLIGNIPENVWSLLAAKIEKNRRRGKEDLSTRKLIKNANERGGGGK